MMDLLQIVRGRTFDDFLFTPQKGLLRRRDPNVVDLSTRFSEQITIQRPNISANMDTITRAEMAIVLFAARETSDLLGERAAPLPGPGRDIDDG
jgi:IMP dehydrogenase/GMP reductase